MAQYYLTSTQTAALFTFMFNKVISFTKIARFLDITFTVTKFVVAESCWRDMLKKNVRWQLKNYVTNVGKCLWSRDSAVAVVLASHQCVRVWFRPCVIYELCQCCWFSPCCEGFHQVVRSSLLHKKHSTRIDGFRMKTERLKCPPF